MQKIVGEGDQICKTWTPVKYGKVEESQGIVLPIFWFLIWTNRVISMFYQQNNTGPLITEGVESGEMKGRWTTLLLYYNVRFMSPPC